MGLWHQFGCPQCGYQAEVSGGNDAGMGSFTTTIVCLDCRELDDIVVAGHETLEAGRPLRCRRSARHTVRPWLRDGSCPRCDTPMQNQGATALWD